jgi:hypothetical protein
MPLIPTKQLNELAPTTEDFSLPMNREQEEAAFEKDYKTTDVLKAAFSLDNTVGSFLTKFNNIETRDNRVSDPNYDAWEDLEGYEDYKKDFVFAETKADVDFIKRNIDDQRSNRKLVNDAGWVGAASQIAAGVLDIVNLVPVGGASVKAFSAGGSILKKGAQVAGGGFMGSTLQELSLQSTQETRTFGESAANIAGATILSGLMGGAFGAIEAKTIAKFEREMNVPASDKPDPMEPNSILLSEKSLEEGTSLSAASAHVPAELDQMKAGLGKKVAEITPFTPNIRLATSPSVESRRVVQQLTETPFIYEKNALGIENPVSVFTRVKMYDTNRYKAIRELDGEYSKYRERVAGSFIDRASAKASGKGKKYLTMREFREEVGRSMRRNDTSPIPEVQAAARAYRKELFEPLKQKGIETGLLPEDVKVKTADSYLTRVYNKEKIAARRPEFKQIIESWLARQPELLSADVDAISDYVINKLLGGHQGRIEYQPIATRGPLKERVLNIPDEQIEDFLESDIEMIGNYYQRTFAPDVELQSQFGSIDLEAEIQKINNDYSRKSAQPGLSEKQQLKLDKTRQRDIKDVEGIRDLVRGTYTSLRDPDGAIRRVFNSARKLNFTRLLGGVTLSSIPDIARPIMTNGFSRVFRGSLKPLIKSTKKFNIAADEAKLAGTALDVELNTRLNAMADINEPYARGTKIERGIDGLSNISGKVFFISQWNSFAKRFAATTTQARILQNSLGEADEIEYMRALGISGSTSRKIAKQFKKYGEREDDLFIANTEKWTDRDAVDKFRAAMSKEIDKTIVTPAPGERPLWMESEVGKTVGQFKTFMFAAHQKILIAGLQEDKMRFMSGATMMVGLGMLSYYLKMVSAGRPVSDDPKQWIAEGLDRSGVFTLLFEANNMQEKFTGYGLASAMGAGPMSRYHSRNLTGALAGPTGGLLEDIGKVTSNIGQDNYSKSDTRAIRRIQPFQNTFYLRRLFNEWEDGINDFFGVKK